MIAGLTMPTTLTPTGDRAGSLVGKGIMATTLTPTGDRAGSLVITNSPMVQRMTGLQ